MELLLVVAVLAIVAAAAAPTFFGGATEAMNEARRSSYLSAYTNTLSGASMYVSILASKGTEPAAGLIAVADINKYVPAVARQFKNGADATVTLNAIYNADKSVSVIRGTTIANTVTADATWDTIKAYTD